MEKIATDIYTFSELRFSGKIGGVSVSGSSQVVLVGRDKDDAPLYKVTLYATPNKGFAGWCETLDVNLTVDEQNGVTGCVISGIR